MTTILTQGAVTAGPFATDVTFNGKGTRLVIQFFADVLANAVQLATARTLGVIGFMVNVHARQVLGQALAFGLLPGCGGRCDRWLLQLQ